MKHYKILIIVMFILFLQGCSNSELSSSFSSPILSEHFQGQSLKYIGDFYNNYLYINPTYDPSLKDGYVAGVYVASEELLILIRNPRNNKIAVFGRASDSKKKDYNDLEFNDIESDSILDKAWAIASGRIKPEKIQLGKNGQNWAHVDIHAQTKEIKHFFVEPNKIETDSKSGMELTAFLVLNQQRYMFYYNALGTQFAPVLCDFFWLPQDEKKYQDIRSNGAEKAVWDFISEKYPLNKS